MPRHSGSRAPQMLARSILLFTLLALTPGCVLPFAWVTPPVHAQGSYTTRFRSDLGRVEPAWDVRVGAAPLAVFEELGERRLDVALGWGLGPGPARGSLLHAIYGELSLHFPHYFIEGDRLALRTQGHFLLPTGAFADNRGGRVVFQVGWEYAKHILDAGAFSDSGGRGGVLGVIAGLGELGIGPYFEMSYAQLAGLGPMWGVSIGLSIRLPASAAAGIAIAVP